MPKHVQAGREFVKEIGVECVHSKLFKSISSYAKDEFCCERSKKRFSLNINNSKFTRNQLPTNAGLVLTLLRKHFSFFS